MPTLDECVVKHRSPAVAHTKGTRALLCKQFVSMTVAVRYHF